MSEVRIINRQILSPVVKRIEIDAGEIAQKALPGQFVVIITEAGGEWIPLAVSETDTRMGAITVIFNEMSPATKRLGSLAIGQKLFSVMGPYGKPATIKKVGTVICIAEELSVAQILPVCRSLRKIGNKLVGIISARTRKGIVLEPQMRLVCQKIVINTQDGSYERKGLAVDVLREFLRAENIHMVYAVGSLRLLKAIAELTRKTHIETLIQINRGIFCGRGICAACRIKVDGQWVLACQEGPEFDAHRFDFDSWEQRTALHKIDQTGSLAFLPDENHDNVIKKFFPGGMPRISLD